MELGILRGLLIFDVLGCLIEIIISINIDFDIKLECINLIYNYDRIEFYCRKVIRLKYNRKWLGGLEVWDGNKYYNF